jgi:hypothetical protein
MEKCVRCKRDLGLGSVVITKVEGDRFYMAHFFCATVTEVRALYGNYIPPTFQLGEPEKTRRKE